MRFPDADILRRRCLRLAATAGLLAFVGLFAQCEVLVPRHSWSRKWGPMVPHKTFPGDCGICHTSEDWSQLREDVRFDHERQTGFALEGVHRSAACLRCHNDRGPVSIYVERGCGGCHVDPHKSTLGFDCQKCHVQQTWAPTGILVEHAQTRLPLTGLHAVVPCESCHERATVGDFRGTPSSCDLCHQEEATRAFPNHPINGWNRDCERCHTPASWATPGFNHDGFPLIGAHAAADCTQCHANGRFAGTPNDCFSCHRNDYLSNPNHVANNTSTDCAQCHNTFAWQ